MSSAGPTAHSRMSDEELRALPPVFGLGVLADLFDIHAATAYRHAKSGALPVPVIRIGSRMKVRRCDLLRFLGIAEHDGASGPSAA